LLVSPPNFVNATLYEKLNYNFIRDIAPVAGLIRVPIVMEVHPSVPAKTVPEFIAYAKANPDKLNMASGGNGTSIHVAGELRLALGQRKPERDQVETAVLSDLVEEAFRGEGVVRFASKKALAIAAAVAPITSSPAPRGFLQALDHDRNHIRRSARPDCSPNRGW
jgi:hypothetical protein